MKHIASATRKLKAVSNCAQLVLSFLSSVVFYKKIEREGICFMDVQSSVREGGASSSHAEASFPP